MSNSILKKKKHDAKNLKGAFTNIVDQKFTKSEALFLVEKSSRNSNITTNRFLKQLENIFYIFPDDFTYIFSINSYLNISLALIM